MTTESERNLFFITGSTEKEENIKTCYDRLREKYFEAQMRN